jgi:hypothetical protein
MAGWGLMIGLGQGLKAASGALLDANKDKMLQQAEVRREERAQQRQIAQEQRAQVRLETTPDPKQTRFIEKDGAMWEQNRSSTGNVLNEQLANKQDIERINLEKRKEEASIQADLVMGNFRAAQMQQTLTENEFLPAKQQLEAEKIRAQTGQAERANQPKPNTKSITEYTDAFLDENPGVVAKYTEGEEAPVTKSELKDVAMKVLKNFVGMGKKPTQKDLEFAMADYVKRTGKSKKSTPSAAGTSGITLPLRRN